MVALVTGCAGFIGSHLCESLVDDGHEVVGVDAFTDTYSIEQKHQNLGVVRQHDAFSLVTSDLAEVDELELCALVSAVDTIFHLAAEPGVRASWGAGFAAYVRNNIVATQRLLEAIQTTRTMPRVVVASSSSIYGDAESLPTPESSTPRPRSPYGMTKLAAEHLCGVYHANFGLPLVALRYFSVYGPRQRPDMAFHRFMRQAMQGEGVSVYGDGQQSRDFTYVSDIVAATRSAAVAEPALGGVFNVGSGSRIALNDVLDLLAEFVGGQLNVVRGPAQAGDARDTSADITRARECLGFKPRVDLQHGLMEEFRWFTTQQAGADGPGFSRTFAERRGRRG